MIVRFDDMSINSDIDAARAMAEHAQKLGYEVWWCVSPLVHRGCGERVFPAPFKALSDQRCFYRVDRMCVPPIPPGVTVCSHGLLHLDHRLLGREAQELSILVSCSLLGSTTYVPPFNKWDASTEGICREHGIRLVKFEDGWRSMEHNEHGSECRQWYLHSRAFTVDKFKAWFE